MSNQEPQPRNKQPIDWEQLARSVGALREDDSEHSGTALAKSAIETMIGDDACRSAVDHYVASQPGHELVRGILWHLQPWSAMERCYEISRDVADIDMRRAAIELLRVVGDHRVLPWIPEFLNDPDAGIQTWGAGIVDQMLFSRLVQPDDCSEILAAMAQHSNERVRETHEFIQSYLKTREQSGQTP